MDSNATDVLNGTMSPPPAEETNSTPTGGGFVGDRHIPAQNLYATGFVVLAATLALLLAVAVRNYVRQRALRRTGGAPPVLPHHRMHDSGRNKRKAVPAEVVAALPVLPYSQAAPDGGASSSELECCVICVTEYKPSDGCKVLPCGHYYHQECIDEWLDRDNTCPICKRLVTSGSGGKGGSEGESTEEEVRDGTGGAARCQVGGEQSLSEVVIEMPRVNSGYGGQRR